MDGKVITEGSASNAYIVTKKGELMTHPANEKILSGITRNVLLALAEREGIKVVESAFTLAQLQAADEAFLTSTSANVLPVVKVDDFTIGSGKVGVVTKKTIGSLP